MGPASFTDKRETSLLALFRLRPSQRLRGVGPRVNVKAGVKFEIEKYSGGYESGLGQQHGKTRLWWSEADVITQRCIKVHKVQ